MLSVPIGASRTTSPSMSLTALHVSTQRTDSRRCDRLKWIRSVGIGSLLAGCLLFHPLVVEAAPPRFPPISVEPNRCERGYTGNTIGQANAVSDKLLDLRKCVYSGKNLQGRVLAGALLQEADLSGANLVEAVFSKAFASGANFEGADMTNSILDRAEFQDANFKNAKLVNSVITGASFENANLENVDFEDALIGGEDVKRLCQNPTLTGESRFQVGCRK